MTDTPEGYQGSLLSARSRRLRTIGIVLLVAVIAMTFYGMRVLMPPINQAATRLTQQEARVAAVSASPARQILGDRGFAQIAVARQHLKVQLAVAYAYWGVCALMLIAILFVAWLDLREISRNYLDHRRAIWVDAIERVKPNPNSGHIHEE